MRPFGALAKSVVGLSIAVLIAGCGTGGDRADQVPHLEARSTDRAGKSITLVYPDWSSERASAHLLQAVLQERLGYQVEMELVSVEQMWERVATGQADMFAGAWLPTTHRDYYREYADRLVDLGANLVGARIGLVVPTTTPGRQTGSSGSQGRDLVTIGSITELRDSVERFDGRIVGIESGAGVVARSQDALEAYDLEGLYRILETSEVLMLRRLQEAVSRGEWIVLTGWRPHWIFEHYSLRFLDDPRGVYGGEESIHTMVRDGFREDFPDAYEVLDRASWSPADLERLMRWINDNRSEPYRQALRWIRVHSETVDNWVGGVE